MRKILFVGVALMVSVVAFASDIKNISITYEYISENPNETPKQAEENAFRNAQTKALEEKFGLDLVGMTAFYQSEQLTNEKVIFSENFLSMSNRTVRGEWIETTERKVLEKTFVDNQYWRIKVYLAGRARNHSTEKADIHYAWINNAHDRHMRKEYYDGDAIMLRFSSPIDGALCVYLIDEDQQANCLLPDQFSGEGYQAIEANKDYLFFYDEEYGEPYLTLGTQKDSEHNLVYIVFSPKTFTKASDHESGKNWRGEQMPRQLSYEDFLKWLAKNQTSDENMVVKSEIITIRK